MRRQNTPETVNAAPQLFEATIPLDAELTLGYIKHAKLAPELGRAQRKLANHEVKNVFDRIAHRRYEHKVANAQQRYDAAVFVTETTFMVEPVATEDQLPLLKVANQMIYDEHIDLRPPGMTGKELAESALITIVPLETPPPQAS